MMLSDPIVLTFLLLIAFQIKHYLIDFVIQLNDPQQLRKFDDKGWFFPLLKHAGQHAIGTGLIVSIALSYPTDLSLSVVAVATIALAAFDLVAHFTMDRIKASPHILGRFRYPDKAYFYALGFDQAVHHLTHYAVIFATIYLIYLV